MPGGGALIIAAGTAAPTVYHRVGIKEARAPQLIIIPELAFGAPLLAESFELELGLGLVPLGPDAASNTHP